MRHQLTTSLGKTVKKISQLRGGGSALPGLFVEKIDRDFMRRTLTTLPMGVVLVSGTNGKTTTTKMVVELLESQGLKVFTNRTGSNFTRGVTAALLGAVDQRGKLDADIAVLELDEAHAVHFVQAVSPSYCLLLNVMRDQLDRFGEIDKTAELLYKIAAHTTKGVVINQDDPRLAKPAFHSLLTVPVRSYGVSPDLLKEFPTDDALHGAASLPLMKQPSFADTTMLEALSDQTARVGFGGTSHTVDLKLRGIYNAQNAVGAIAVTRMVLGDTLNVTAMLTALAAVTPAFGRGESIAVGETTYELVLVKNPAGFRLSLKSFSPKDTDTMIVINDDYADGRDMSWLWDVDFDSLTEGVKVVSGVRAYDMALRLQYDEVLIGTVELSVDKALAAFMQQGTQPTRRIYCTYTAMLSVRKLLGKYTSVETVR
ncbi:DUF1727 domain-containing protein [Candidatus Saccharibacteria bacterium]|nr:DUF1727 domain-containing protein [Candidatus Saccharibacteria bacterium]